MELLPSPLLAQVMLCLPFRDITSSFQRINKKFLSVFKQSYNQTQYLSTLLRVSEKTEIRSDAALSVLQKLTRNKVDVLRFIGLATSGGIFRDYIDYWVDEGFRFPRGNGYCTLNGPMNINVMVGLHYGYQDDPLNPASIQDVENPANYPSTQPLRRYPERQEILIDESLIRRIHAVPVAAAITGFDMIRNGGFTCPLRSFVVLASMHPIDIEDDQWKTYDGLTEAGMVQTLPQSVQGFPTIYNAREEHEDYVMKTFSPSSLPLRPLIWVQAKPEHWRLSIQLPYPVLCRFLYFKMIDSENIHRDANPNIDLPAVCVAGVIVPLVDNSS